MTAPTPDRPAGESSPVEDAVLGFDLGPASADQGDPGHDVARAAARRAQTVNLRLMGLTYEQIAQQQHYSDRSAARAVVVRALDRVEARLVGEYRDLENARYDAMQAAVFPLLYSGTPEQKIATLNSLIRLADRRAKLNGLDAPTKLEVGAGAQAQLEDALAQLRDVVLGEVLDSTADQEEAGDRRTS